MPGENSTQRVFCAALNCFRHETKLSILNLAAISDSVRIPRPFNIARNRETVVDGVDNDSSTFRRELIRVYIVVELKRFFLRALTHQCAPVLF